MYENLPQTLARKRRELRQEVLVRGIDKEVGKALHQNFVSDDNINRLKPLEDKYGCLLVDAALDVRSSLYQRKKRIRDKINVYVLSGHTLFLTLTFKDEVLASTTAETRRRYVSRYLKENCVFYVANVDFGEKNGREHYHALVLADKVDFKAWHPYGGIKCYHVKDSKKDANKTALYVSKLTNHALKHEGFVPRLIYSRVDKKKLQAYFDDPPF